MTKLHRHILLGIHATLAILWIYQGLVPKILVQAPDELRIWTLQGIPADHAAVLMQMSGCAEIVFGLLFFIFRKSQLLHVLNLLAMLLLSGLIVWLDPSYFLQAFNPFVMNLAMATLSIIAIALIQEEKNTNLNR